MKGLFVVSGPSGCGKTTLVKKVLEEMNQLAFSISHTTRKRRVSEIDGKDYFFVSEETFKGMLGRKAFVEWAEVHGNFYGTSREEIEKTERGIALMLDIDIQGARQIKEKYEKAVLIFVFPPRFAELKRRLSQRGDETEESVQKRLAAAKKEILSYPHFDYIIVNDRLEEATRELEAIVLSVRCRRESRQEAIQPILKTFLLEE